MKPTFVKAIERFQARLRRQALVAAVGRAGLILLSWIGLLGIGDYVLRFDDRGLRALLLTITGVIGIAVYLRWIRPVLQLPINGLTVARWLEHRDPALKGKLAAAWEFAHAPARDTRWGSPTLRVMVVDEVEEASSKIWELCRDAQGPSVIPFYLMGFAVLCLSVGVIISPVVFGTALIRLFNPLSDLPWPQKTHLKIISYPEVISRGGSFVVEVGEEVGSLPEQVWIGFRDAASTGGVTTRFRMVLQEGKFVFQRDHVQSDFEFRVWGGDDHSQPWRLVRVIEPPRLVDLRVHLVPPLYTGWPREVTRGPIRAIAGTTAVIEGKADRELLRVWAEREPDGLLEGQLLNDRRSFILGAESGVTKEHSSGWVLKQSGRYRIRLRATDGTTSIAEAEWEVRVVNDLPPVVTAELQVPLPIATRRGKLPFHVSAKDDVGLNRIVVNLEQENVIKVSSTVYEDSRSTSGSRGSMSDPESWGQVLDRDQIADFGQCEGIGYGSVKLLVKAEDLMGQTSVSTPLEIQVLPDDEFRDRLLSESERIADQLSEIYVLQTQVNRDWSATWQKIRESPNLEQPVVDQLQALDLLQTEVIHNLGSPTGGVLSGLFGLVKLIENNLVGFAEEKTLREAYARLGRGFQELAVPLQTSRGNFVRRVQHLLESTLPREETEQQIMLMQQQAEEIIRQQEAWEEFLAALIDFMGGIKSRNIFRRHLEMILQKERVLTSQTQKLGAKTIGRDRQELGLELVTALNALSQEQTDIASELESLLGRISGSSSLIETGRDRLEVFQAPQQDSPPGPSDGRPQVLQKRGTNGGELESHGSAAGIDQAAVEQALTLAFRSAVVAKMRDAASALKGNRISEAISLQKQCIAILEEMLRILSGLEETAQVYQEWRALAEQLKTLERSQKQLVEDFRERWQDAKASGNEAEFSTRQSEILEQTESVLRNLPAPRGEKLQEHLQGALSHMAAARAAASRGDRKEALEHATNALHDLADAQQEVLAEELAQLGKEANLPLLQQIRELVGVMTNQNQVLQETKTLEQRRPNLKLPEEIDTWRKEVLDLAERQRKLQERTASLQQTVVDMGVWESVLGDVARNMEEAAARLNDNDTGKITQTIQSEALEALQSLVEALAYVPEDGTGEQNGASGASPSGTEQEQRGQMPWKVAVQLQALRILQSSIHSRTESLAKQLGQNEQPSEELRYLMDRLEKEQVQVVRLAKRLKDEISEGLPREESSPKDVQGGQPSAPAEKRPPPAGPIQKPLRPGSLDDLISP